MDALLFTVLTFVVVISVLAVVAFMIMSHRDDAKRSDNAGKCGICFGDLGGRTAVCACGKMFHDSCAQPTGSCPYCKAEYGSFSVRKESAVRCMNCGRQVTGDRCRCGAIFPEDGRFECLRCGSVVDGGLVCGKCGAKYVKNSKLTE